MDSPFGFDIGSFLGSILSGTGLGIGRSGMHPQTGADLAHNAYLAGLSPLAMAGQPLQSGFGASVGDAGAAGQLLARSFQRTQSSKLEGLREQNLELQNRQLENDIVAQQVRNAHAVTQLGAVGSPPTWAAGSEGSPFFGPVSPFSGPHPTLQRNADGSISRTKEQAEITFAGDPIQMLKNALESFGRELHDPSPTPSDIYHWFTRPDIWRGVNPPVDPSTGTYGGQ